MYCRGVDDDEDCVTSPTQDLTCPEAIRKKTGGDDAEEDREDDREDENQEGGENNNIQIEKHNGLIGGRVGTLSSNILNSH